MFKKLKNIFKKANFKTELKIEEKIVTKQEKSPREITKEIHELYYENGVLKEYCSLNIKGELTGYLIKYDDQGEEIEKILYENGLRLGNPFENLTPEEIVEKLGGEIEQDYIDEVGEEFEITPEVASTMLKGKKYYKN